MNTSLTRRRLLASVGLAATGSGVSDAATLDPQNAVQASEGKRITLLHFTDTHAQLETHQDYLPGADEEIQMMGGFARLKTAIERERATCKDACLLLDGGDDFQGSGPAAWSEGEAILEPLKAFGIDVFVPGNWDPVYGPERFKTLMGQLGFPVVCYNFHDIASGQRLFPASVTIVRQGVKTIVLGVTDIGASKRQSPAEFHGMDTTRMAGLRDYVKEIRARENPDLVVALTHTGLTMARQLAREVPEIDVVLSGHTHERTSVPILEANVIVVEAGCFGSFLGRLDLVMKPGGGVAHHEFRLIPILEQRYAEDAHMKALVDSALAPHRQRMANQIGQSETVLMRYDLLETTADDFIADAVRETAKTDIALTNGFRFGLAGPPGPAHGCRPMEPVADGSADEARLGHRQELRAYFENEFETVYSKNPWKHNGGWGARASGLTLTFKALADYGQRVVSIKLNGKEIEPDGQYTIAGCERPGEAIDMICRHPDTHEVTMLGQSVHEALALYLKSHPVIAPRRDGRERAIDLPDIVFSQDAVLAGGELSKAPTTPFGIPPG